jgi:hypothetical protein
LGAERANAQDVRDGVGVPAFGQHRHRNNATNLLPEATFAANGVHDLPQESALAHLGVQAAGPFTGRKLALERIDFR